MTSILSLIATVLFPILKWIMEKKAKRKLNDKEFVDYIERHQEMRGRAGQAAIDWRKSVTKMREAREKLLTSMAKKKDAVVSAVTKKKTDESTTKEE